MSSDLNEYRVIDLQRAGCLLVEDGNHGENRPRPSEFGCGQTAFIRAADMHGGRILFETAGKINDVALARITKGKGRGGDVLFSHKGTVGKLALAPLDAPPFVCSPQTTFWRALDEDRIDRRYLFYYMSSRRFREQWHSRKGETDMADYVSLTSQRELFVVIPRIDEQRAIARVLGALDDKIELNHQTNHTLETMAQALFKSWFTYFDPVIAKAAGRKPYGMNEEIAALFPDSFEDSELGLIPESWDVSTVGVEYNLTMGQSPPGSTYNEAGEGLPFYQGRTDFTFRFPSKRIYCTAPTRIAESGDTLVSVRAPVGDVNMASEKCAIGRGVAALRHTGDWESYTYYAMRSLRQDFDVFEGEGTLFGAVGRTGFEGISVVAPPAELIEKYEQKASPLDKRIRINEEEAQTLSSLRDVLLPKLLAGEIRVRDGEKLVAEAV